MAINNFQNAVVVLLPLSLIRKYGAQLLSVWNTTFVNTFCRILNETIFTEFYTESLLSGLLYIRFYLHEFDALTLCIKASK